MSEQAEAVTYIHSLYYTSKAAEDLANILIDSTVGEMARVFVVSSGSEAMEAALKLARQYHLEKTPAEPKRTQFIARQQSYHGATLGVLAAGGHMSRRAMYEGILATNNHRVSPCYPYRGLTSASESDQSYVDRLEAELEAEFQRVGPERVAAFIAEPVGGVALGCVAPVPGYFKAVRRVCDKYGALLIFDEIMCGTGRIGPEPTDDYPMPLHAWQDPLVGVTPDIMTLGKSLGGGFIPIAAIMATHKVVDQLRKGTGGFAHAQTYQGHPLACRAAAEVLRIIYEEGLVANVRRQGALLGALLQEKVAGHWAVGQVRGKGLFWGIEFVANKTTKEAFPSAESIALRIQELGESTSPCRDQSTTHPRLTNITGMQNPYNIFLLPGTGSIDGFRGDHIVLAPAYNVAEQDIRDIVESVAAVITDFFRAYTVESSSRL